MRGRKAKPTETHKRIGSYRKDRHADRADVTISAVKTRDCPSWLSPIAQQHWPQILGLLEACGYMSDQHRPGLALLCDAIADHIEISDLYRKAKPAKAVKLYIQKAKSMELLRSMLREFGLTPAAVASIKTKTADDKKPSGKKRFFDGPRLASG